MLTLTRRLFGAAFMAALASLAAATVVLGQDREVVVISDTLAPKRLGIAAGTVVTWRNADRERHRVRSREGPVEFDSGNLEPGERFSVTFVVPGEYPYRDERNDEDGSYFGTVVVIDEGSSGGPPPTEATVTLIDESFQPPALEVAVGATVTWQNIDGDDDHTVTSDEGVFDSGVLPAGSAFEHTFDMPGTYAYFCAIHPEMQGTISVVGEAPAPAEDPASAEDPAAESPTPEEPAATAGMTVSIADFDFEPATIEVDAGTTLTWTNDDGVSHTVTANEGDFDSGRMTSGQSFSQTFETPGSYDYFCVFHPFMTGMVVVREAAAPDEVEDPAVGSDASDTTDATDVSVVNVAFQPGDIEITVGTTVSWSNDDPFAHTVTARDGAFDSGNLGAGQTFSQTFQEPGTHEYFCAIHPSMTGTITVRP